MPEKNKSPETKGTTEQKNQQTTKQENPQLKSLKDLKETYNGIVPELKSLQDEIKNAIDEKNRDEKVDKAKKLRDKAKATKEQIDETIKAIEASNDASAKTEAWEIIKAINTTKDEIDTLYDNIIITLSSTGKRDLKNPTRRSPSTLQKIRWWIWDQWNDVRNKDKWKDDKWKNILRTIWFSLTWIWGIALIWELIKSLIWNRGKNKTKKKSFWNKGSWKTLKRLWLWTIIWGWIFYLFGKKNNRWKETDNENELDIWNNNPETVTDLTPEEKKEMEQLVEESKNPNTKCYLEIPTYVKYLNIIERDLSLPRHSLEYLCSKESYWWFLYKDWKILTSDAGAKWLFQFMDKTAGEFMQDQALWKTLNDKYWKSFQNKDEFIKDPLATAWAAGILLSKRYMEYYHLNFQSALACYNWWEGNYQNNTNGKNLNENNFKKFNKETKDYVLEITKKILIWNSVIKPNDQPSLNNLLTADLKKLS